MQYILMSALYVLIFCRFMHPFYVQMETKQCSHSLELSLQIVVWVDPLDGTSEYTQGT